MSKKISIAYIGTKAIKKDTITGSRCVFPRNTPVEVEEAIAYRLLDFPSVWVKASELKPHLEAEKTREAEMAKLEKEQEEAAKKAALDASMVVEWGGETMKRLDDGWCSAVDRDTFLCTIYENRPWICREFEMGSDECRDVFNVVE